MEPAPPRQDGSAGGVPPGLSQQRRRREEDVVVDEEEVAGWLCAGECAGANGGVVESSPPPPPDEQVAIEAALKASADEFELSKRDDDESLAAALELSRRSDAERQRALAASSLADEDALAMAIEMSKKDDVARAQEEELVRRAVDASRRASQIAAQIAAREDARLLEEALRQSTLDSQRPPRSAVAPPLGDDPAAALAAKAIEDSDLELTLHMSEQVQSLEDVLDADADEEQLRFALQASREQGADEYKSSYL